MAYRHHSEFYDPKYKENSKRRELEDMLREWYGNAYAAVEITCRTDEPQKISKSLDKLMQSRLSSSALLTVQINENWDKLIGPPLNRFCRLAAIRDQAVIVEVSHPAFLIQLRKPDTAQQWYDILKNAFPDLEAEKVIFVPAGQTPR
ncbi:MAG: DUF721 domain-containing protein [Lentisphaerae bacterium]|nr:DUF721 domain-containing protein [Lentisphaerota bacterium]